MEPGRPDSMHALAGAQQAVVFPSRIAALGSHHVELDAPLPCDVQVGPLLAAATVPDLQDHLARREPASPPAAKEGTRWFTCWRCRLVGLRIRLTDPTLTLFLCAGRHVTHKDKPRCFPRLAIVKPSGGSFERMQAGVWVPDNRVE